MDFHQRAPRERAAFPAETALLVYLLVSAASAWVLRPPHVNWILLGHGLTIGVFGILRQALPPLSSQARTARALFPLALFPALYKVSGLVNAGVGKWILDKPMENLEAALFGLQPSVALSRWLSSPFVSELLHVFYLGVFPLAVAVPLAFAYQKRHELLTATVYCLCVCFFVTLLFHVWLPVTSPFHRFPPLTTALTRGLIYRVSRSIVENVGVVGASFPSSHVAIAVLNALIAFRFCRRAFWYTAAPTLAMLVGAVYGRFSFGVDILAAALLSIVSFRLLRGRLDRSARSDAQRKVGRSAPVIRMSA